MCAKVVGISRGGKSERIGAMPSSGRRWPQTDTKEAPIFGVIEACHSTTGPKAIRGGLPARQFESAPSERAAY